MAENGSNGTAVAPATEEMVTEEQPSTVSAAKELAAATMAEASRLANEKGDNVAFNEPASKKARLTDDQIEEKDFDKETQKALEEIDANQNEIDALNERKLNEYLCRCLSNIVHNMILLFSQQETQIVKFQYLF